LMLIAALGDQVGTQTTLARAVAYAGDPRTEVPTANPADGADILVSSLGPNGADWNLMGWTAPAPRHRSAIWWSC
jgi:thermitase